MLCPEWLQSYLNRYRGDSATHDRYFLDRVTNRIIEIDRGDIYTYAGNYSYLEKAFLKSLPSAASASIKALRRELNGSSESSP